MLQCIKRHYGTACMGLAGNEPAAQAPTSAESPPKTPSPGPRRPDPGLPASCQFFYAS